MLAFIFTSKYSIYIYIQGGRTGFGNYKLEEEFQFADLDPSDIVIPKCVEHQMTFKTMQMWTF